MEASMSRGIFHRRWRLKNTVGTALVALMSCGVAAAEEGNDHADGVKTATPIKHVIVLIGENRTFDNVYATYTAKHGQSVGNLLSRGIVNADGSPGPHRNAAQQFRVDNITPPLYFISTNKLTPPNKTAYSILPTPEAGGAPNRRISVGELAANPTGVQPPFDNSFTDAQLRAIEPSLEHEDLVLLQTGATGLPTCPAPTVAVPSPCPDTRVTNFHMWQQSDCDVANATPTNPSGCLNDLYPFVGIARLDDSGSNAMGFYNVQKGDASV